MPALPGSFGAGGEAVKRMHSTGALLGALLIVALGSASVAEAVPPVSTGELADLSLEDLMDLEITSVSKKAARGESW